MTNGVCHMENGKCFSFYSCRSASTGSRREELTAGYSPKIKPTAAETPNDMAIEFQVTSVFHSAYIATTRETTKPKTTPINPPTKLIVRASIKNCCQMSRRRAPRLRRTPISRVRSRMLADRKSTRLNSSHLGISYAVFCLKKKKNIKMFATCKDRHTIRC